MMLGSIPQQDVFQRVMSAKDVQAATRGPVIGGACYILFAFVPMFLVTSALVIMPEQAADADQGRPAEGPARRWCWSKMPLRHAGAVLRRAAVGASSPPPRPRCWRLGHLRREHLAPVLPAHERQARAAGPCASPCWCSASACCAYAIALQGTPIYDMVSGAYQVTLVGAFVPLVAGLYWKRATTQGAMFSIVLGIADLDAVHGHAGRRRRSRRSWRASDGACVGMVVGSLAPQAAEEPARLAPPRGGRAQH